MQNDKIQLAAMGEHIAEQAEQAEQPMCMAKRIDELTELLREVAPCVSFMINRIGDSETLRHATQLAEHIDEVLDSYQVSATPRQVPEGWQLVPVEPTEEMCEAGANAPLKVRQAEVTWIGVIYRAMLAAAPRPEAK